MTEFLTIKQYDTISEKLLVRNGLKLTNHNIAFVNEMMMKADMKYQDDVTCKNRGDFRIFYAIFAIRTLKKNLFINNKKKKKSNFIHLMDDLPDLNLLSPRLQDFIFVQKENGSPYISQDIFNKIKKSKMSEREILICEHIMFNFDKKIDIAKDIGVSKQCLDEIIKGIKRKHIWLLDLLG